MLLKNCEDLPSGVWLYIARRLGQRLRAGIYQPISGSEVKIEDLTEKLKEITSHL